MPKTARSSTMPATRISSSAAPWSTTRSERATRREDRATEQHGLADLQEATGMTVAMRSFCKFAALAALLVLMMGPAARPGAAQTPAQDATAAMQGQLGEQVLDGRNTELARYCAEVTPGEARLL